MEFRKIGKTAFCAVTLIFYYLINYCNSFIIVPNEVPSLLSIIYSNIPPVKLGFDTRFGIGFRIGPHADFQTLVEIGPQTNTNPISTNGTVAKRQSDTPKRLHRLRALQKSVATKPEKNSSKGGKKSDKTVVGKVEFKKIPGIDYVSEKPKKTSSESSPTKFVLL